MTQSNSKTANATRIRLAKLFEAWHSCDNAYLKLVRQWGISLNTVWALEYMNAHLDGVEPAVLADDTHMLRQTITVVLNDLEERGYLRRTFHATDRRKKIIKLTRTGLAFSKKVLAAINEAELEAASSLSEEEQQMLLELSSRFCTEFDKRVTHICETAE